MASSTVATREKPIIFTGDSVRAILDGRKTQTRRVVKPQPTWIETSGRWQWPLPRRAQFPGCCKAVVTASREWWEYAPPEAYPYRVGDVLWVRETWCHKSNDGSLVYNAEDGFDSSCCHYAADGANVIKIDDDGFMEFRKDGTQASPWRSPMFMPRWATRLYLEVTDVRVQRVQEISEADAKAEGMERSPAGFLAWTAFRELWNSLNAKRGFPWDANPWVWVYTFKRLEATP